MTLQKAYAQESELLDIFFVFKLLQMIIRTLVYGLDFFVYFFLNTQQRSKFWAKTILRTVLTAQDIHTLYLIPNW